LGPVWNVMVGSCATPAREPSQGREAAALSGSWGVPQTTWPSLSRPGRRVQMMGPNDSPDGFRQLAHCFRQLAHLYGQLAHLVAQAEPHGR